MLKFYRALQNAGRRKSPGAKRKSMQAPLPMGDVAMMRLGSAELVAMGTAEAFAELSRRNRDANGEKLAWQKAKKAAANPLAPPVKESIVSSSNADLERSRQLFKGLALQAKQSGDMATFEWWNDRYQATIKEIAKRKKRSGKGKWKTPKVPKDIYKGRAPLRNPWKW